MLITVQANKSGKSRGWACNICQTICMCVYGCVCVLIISYVNLNRYKTRENNIMIFMYPMSSFNNDQLTADLLNLNIVSVSSPNNYFETNIIFP